MTQEKTKIAAIGHFRRRSASEESVVYLVGSVGHYVLQGSSARSNVEFGQILFPVGPIKGGHRRKTPQIVQTLPLFADQSEIGTAWLRRSTTSTLLGLPLISILRNFS